MRGRAEDNCDVATKEAIDMVETQGRDALEGRYTQAAPETAEGRTVHGQYTEGEGHPEPDTEIAGAYVGSQREGKPRSCEAPTSAAETTRKRSTRHVTELTRRAPAITESVGSA